MSYVSQNQSHTNLWNNLKLCVVFDLLEVLQTQRRLFKDLNARSTALR